MKTPNKGHKNGQINSIICVDDAVQQFLKDKATSSTKGYISTLTPLLRELVVRTDGVPLKSVTPQQISDIALRSGGTRSTSRLRLQIMRAFFNWARNNGVLPGNFPTAAEQVPMPPVSSPPAPFSSGEVRDLLLRANDVEVQAFLALGLFAGLRRVEILQLRWADIEPGGFIAVTRGAGGRLVAILPVLEAWLRPFYGSEGQVVSSHCNEKVLRYIRTSGTRWAPNILRHTFAFTMHGLTHSGFAVAKAMGIPPRCFGHFTSAGPNREAAEIMTLTPQAVGIADWPERVSQYLKARKRALRRRGKRGPQTPGATATHE